MTFHQPPPDPKALIQLAQLQVQANRYAFLRRASNKNIIKQLLQKR